VKNEQINLNCFVFFILIQLSTNVQLIKSPSGDLSRISGIFELK